MIIGTGLSNLWVFLRVTWLRLSKRAYALYESYPCTYRSYTRSSGTGEERRQAALGVGETGLVMFSGQLWRQ